MRSEIPSGICAKLRTVAAINNRLHMPWSLLLLVRATYTYCCCSSRTSRSWWITQSTQHHRRGCNSTVTIQQSQVKTFLSNWLLWKYSWFVAVITGVWIAIELIKRWRLLFQKNDKFCYWLNPSSYNITFICDYVH